MPSSTGPVLPPPHHLQLEVHGSVPPGLSGRWLGVAADGAVHALDLGPGPVPTAAYRTQQLPTVAPVRNVVAFGGTVLVFSDDSLAHELSAALDTFRAVDLAGQRRVPAPFPQHDPATGELHLVARGHDHTQFHIIVTAGALTRRGRPIEDAPGQVTDLTLTPDHVVFTGEGFVGIAAREVEARITWITTARLGVLGHGPGDDAVHVAGCWLVGLFPAGTAGEFRISDAADLTAPPVATVRLPAPVAPGLRCAWIPSTQR